MVKRIDGPTNKDLNKLVFLAREIESNEQRVVKVYLSHEQGIFAQELQNLMAVSLDMTGYKSEKIVPYIKYQ